MNEEKIAISVLSLVAIILCIALVHQYRDPKEPKNSATMTKQLREHHKISKFQTVPENKIQSK